MFNIGPLELMIILIVALLVVGPQRLPEVGRSVGKGIREFRRAQDEVKRSLRLSLDDEATTNGKPRRPARAKRTPGESRHATVTAGAENGSGASDEAVREHAPDAATRVGATQGGDGTGDELPSGQDIARTIGRGLAQLRRAREELQQSFRVDIDEPDAGD